MRIFNEPFPQMNDTERRIDAGFHEMPGMRLTAAQGRRLWNLSPQDCGDALDHLCESGRLARDDSGRYLLGRFDC